MLCYVSIHGIDIVSILKMWYRPISTRHPYRKRFVNSISSRNSLNLWTCVDSLTRTNYKYVRALAQEQDRATPGIKLHAWTMQSRCSRSQLITWQCNLLLRCRLAPCGRPPTDQQSKPGSARNGPKRQPTCQLPWIRRWSGMTSATWTKASCGVKGPWTKTTHCATTVRLAIPGPAWRKFGHFSWTPSDHDLAI